MKKLVALASVLLLAGCVAGCGMRSDGTIYLYALGPKQVIQTPMIDAQLR